MSSGGEFHGQRKSAEGVRRPSTRRRDGKLPGATGLYSRHPRQPAPRRRFTSPACGLGRRSGPSRRLGSGRGGSPGRAGRSPERLLRRLVHLFVPVDVGVWWRGRWGAGQGTGHDGHLLPSLVPPGPSECKDFAHPGASQGDGCGAAYKAQRASSVPMAALAASVRGGRGGRRSGPAPGHRGRRVFA